MNITVLSERMIKDFCDYIKKMPSNYESQPFIADVQLFSAHNEALAVNYNEVFKKIKFMTLYKNNRLYYENGLFKYEQQYGLKLFNGTEESFKKPFKDIIFSPKEWFYNDGVIFTYFGDDPTTLRISEKKLKDIININ